MSYDVAFVDDSVRKEFEKLESGKTSEQKLRDFIDRAIDDLKKDPCVGIKIPKKNWPKEYVKKYKITNLWKYDLPDAWRLIYTIGQDEVCVIAIILEWFNHKDYSKRFGYKNK